MKYKTKYSDDIVDLVRKGATKEEQGLNNREYYHIVKYRIQGVHKLKNKQRPSDGHTGRHSWHSKPIGSERFDKDGYILVKIAYPRVERRKHLIEWEKYNEPTNTKTECLIFLDGDRTNCNVENLFKIKRKYMSTINQLIKTEMAPELRKIAIKSAILYLDAKEKEDIRRHKGKHGTVKKPDDYWMAINLKKQGFSNREIAEKMQTSLPNIQWKLRSARLRGDLDEAC